MTVYEWILTAEARHLPPEPFVTACVEQLQASRFPVDRLVFTLRTMHPEVWLESVRWDAKSGAHVLRRPHQFERAPLFSESPVALMYRGGPGFRQKLTGFLPPESYPILHELKADGFTDYLIDPLQLKPGLWSYVSCATRAGEGFSDENLELWTRLLPPFAAVVSEMSTQLAFDSLLRTYVGHEAAKHITSGQFKRGDGAFIDAVIWFCDLRNFTGVVDQNSPDLVIRRLDCYFDVVGEAIESHGGEILKFIGDGILAVFPIGSQVDECEVASKALSASQTALRMLSKGEDAPGGPIQIGIGLHAGRVSFGNVGTEKRLDFTVIGSPVNVAARVESLCKSLKEPLLMTEAFARMTCKKQLLCLGSHAIRGISEPQTLYALHADAAPDYGPSQVR